MTIAYSLPPEEPAHPDDVCPTRAEAVPEAEISIPVVSLPKALRARRAHLEKGRHLARQDRWDELAKLMRTADRRRLLVSDGAPVADLLAEGARADAMEAARDAVAQNDARGARAPLEALAEALKDELPNTAMSLFLARAHFELASAWCGPDGLAPVMEDRHRPYSHHLTIATRLTSPLDPVALDSPMLARLRCDLLVGELRPKDRLVARYDTLVSLAPQIPANLRRYGTDLLPRRFGSYDTLEAQARNVAAETASVWGRGGYVWVYLDALSQDSGALRKLDADVFLGGMADILERCDDQHTINILAAFTGYSMACDIDRRPARRKLAGAFAGIVQNHLREVHPAIWASATRPVANVAGRSDPVEPTALGKRRALETLELHFSAPLQRGQSIRFTDAGPEVVGQAPLAPEDALG